jgi:hypothetical protein
MFGVPNGFLSIAVEPLSPYQTPAVIHGADLKISHFFFLVLLALTRTDCFVACRRFSSPNFDTNQTLQWASPREDMEA